jgi:prepilin-type processing-associated H-X9-DG protein
MFVLVAEVKDRAKFEETWKRLAERTEIPVAEEQEERGVTRTLFEGDGGLTRGDNWLAIGYPMAPLKEAEELAAGRMTPSLAGDSAYQKVMAGLPKDALLTEYIGPQVLRQLSAAATLLLPSVEFSLPPKEGIGIAVGMRVEDQGGRRMLTVYKTADLDSLSYLLDVPLSIAATAAYPAMVQSQESARKVQCLSNVKNVALAVQMYVADNDKFPEADKWVDQLTDYLANEEVLKCPEDKSDAKCSYGFNASLSGKSAAEIADPSRLVVIYETVEPGDCPSGGAEDVASPARHIGGNNFGYADGHAKWCREGEPVAFEESAQEEQEAPQD